MGKTIKINEQQLATLVNYIKENEQPLIVREEQALNELLNEELLEEGMLNKMVAGLSLLAALAGSNAHAQKIQNELPKDKYPEAIEAAIELHNDIEAGDSTVYKYFDQAQIDASKKNLEALKDVEDAKLQKFKTKYASTAQAKLKSGDWSLADIEITQDTVWGDLPAPTVIDSIVSMDFDGNTFVTADFQLNDEVKAQIDNMIAGAQALNADIEITKVYGTTDKEPIKVGGDLWNMDIKTNQDLAEARAKAIVKYLESKGVKVDPLDIKYGVEIGDVEFSKTMDDRGEKRGEATEFRTSGFEGKIKGTIAPSEDERAYTAFERNSFLLIGEKSSGEHKTKTGTKKYKCELKTKNKTGKIKGIPCPEF